MAHFNKYQLFLELILLTEVEFNKINNNNKKLNDSNTVLITFDKGGLRLDMNLHEKMAYDYMNILSVMLPENWSNDKTICDHVAILLMIIIDLNIEPFFCFDLPDNINLLIELIKNDYKFGKEYYNKFNKEYGCFTDYLKYGNLKKEITNESELTILNAKITAMTLYKLHYTHNIDVTSSHFISKLLEGDSNYWQLFILNTGEEFVPIYEEISPSILSLPIQLNSNKNRQIFTIDTLKDLCREKMTSVTTEVIASAPPIVLLNEHENENENALPIATAVFI